MREIKFKGRVKKDNLPQYKKGQIVYGYPVKGENTYIHTNEEFYSAVVSMDWRMCTSVVLVEDDIEQFTGLKDKNGVEIYEGDILEGYCPNDFDNKRTNVVSYHNQSTSTDRFSVGFHTSLVQIEVIGNIHRNKDLL